MWHETYHAVAGEELDYVIKDLTEGQKQIAIAQINAATEAKTRNYRIVIVPPNADDGKGGIWFDIENGLVKGSSNQK